jgi:glutamyl-tRNA synthetase/glutamyl-Q tRNA(Asp) synthetase
VPRGALTRFAPAPTGFLHLGHVANAIWTWGVAGAVGGRVLLRIEDHDRQRCRPEHDREILEELTWLGFEHDRRPVRQSQPDALAAYARALGRLREADLVYGCDCARSTFDAWAEANGRRWSGPGCPGACRARGSGADAPTLRVALGNGDEAWDDLLAGARSGPVAPAGDLVVRDRHGNWTYGFCVVVDDLRQGIDLVVRGRDLLHATPAQIRLGRLLGRASPPTFLHHPLIHRPDGSKLSKSAGDTGVRDLRAAGLAPDEVIGRAAAAAGLVPAPRPIAASEAAGLVVV